MFDPNSREERAFLSALHEHRDAEPSYLQMQARLAYVNGTDDQWEGDSIDSLREQLSKPYVGLHKGDSEDTRKEFNRRFNEIINYHSELWHNDDAPSKDRDRAFFAYRYFRLFDDIMRLFEKFPDVGSDDDYWHIVATVRRYRDFYDKHKYDAFKRK